MLVILDNISGNNNGGGAGCNVVTKCAAKEEPARFYSDGSGDIVFIHTLPVERIHARWNAIACDQCARVTDNWIAKSLSGVRHKYNSVVLSEVDYSYAVGRGK